MLLMFARDAGAFEGEIDAALIRGGQSSALRYTVGPDHLRIEVTGTNWPNPIDVVERASGALTLVYPHNRSFVRLTSAAENPSAGMPGNPGMPMPPGTLPPGIGPQAHAANPNPNPNRMPMPAMPPGMPPGIGPQSSSPMSNRPGIGAMMPAMPAMPRRPMMPMMMGPKPELKATGQTTNILGFACQQYEIKQRGETLEIWATDRLPPYQPYIRNQPSRFGPQMLEDQWPDLLAARKLFPMLASQRYDSGAERFRFEVTSVSAKEVAEPDEKLFQPPPDYREVRPLPF